MGWRFKATDPTDLAFNVYRDGTKVNSEPLSGATNILDADGSAGDSYTIRPVLDGEEQEASPAKKALTQTYVRIPLAPGTTQAGRLVGTADLNGDCEYDFVVKRSNDDQDVTQTADQSPATIEETIKLEAYTHDGKFLWRRDLGYNVETGVWFSPFFVYDLNGDGKAEIALKASEVGEDLEGGEGDLNNDGQTDYRADNGEVYMHQYPDIEFLEVWDGETGITIARTPWISVTPWGSDGYRYGRNMIAPAYLDGNDGNASIIAMRGGNTRTIIEAFDLVGDELVRRWDATRSPNGGNYGHNVRIGDIDDDGKQELLYFTVAFDDNGDELWNTQQAHGDRFYLTDINPDRPGMELFYVHEFSDVYDSPIDLRAAESGEKLWGPGGDWGDVGRGLAANIDADSPGYEMWASGSDDLYSSTGEVIGKAPNANNMSIWWDSDLEHEHLDGTSITKPGGQVNAPNTQGCRPGNRNAPMGSGDVLGDWREEVWYICDNNSELRVYTTTDVTNVRMYTPMQNPEYRMGVAVETQGYMQAPQTGFYVGSDMAPPPAPYIHIPPGT
ncbi:MAG: hypothetical protein JXR76_19910 [Deltaproteobacteria bacterium]|nr:hypothetical protein [Deltaproteobacteria bacterium]